MLNKQRADKDHLPVECLSPLRVVGLVECLAQHIGLQHRHIHASIGELRL